MNNQRTKANRGFPLSNKVWMYACLLPVFGLVPSLMVSIGDRNSQEVKNAGKVSILLALAWLTISATLGNAGQPSESIQVPMELLKGTVTSTYFIACTWLMFRLYRGKKIGLPWSERSAKKGD
jgi:hypothetical protein